MPLSHDANSPIANQELFSLRFRMTDGAKQVTITVTSEALQDIAAPDGRHMEPIETLFDAYRDRVEKIASDKYDHLGEPASVTVVNGDV